MVVVPALLPLTTPEVFTEAIAELLLLHTPPVIASVSVITAPAQTLSAPSMVPASGKAFTVTLSVVVANPHELEVYEIVAVPGVSPVTTPDALIVAIAPLLLLHPPPVATLLNVIAAPAHTLSTPRMVPTSGSGFVVTL